MHGYGSHFQGIAVQLSLLDDEMPSSTAYCFWGFCARDSRLRCSTAARRFLLRSECISRLFSVCHCYMGTRPFIIAVRHGYDEQCCDAVKTPFSEAYKFDSPSEPCRLCCMDVNLQYCVGGLFTHAFQLPFL